MTDSAAAFAEPSARRTIRWRFRAADAAGVAHAGEIDAVSEREAADLLRRRALWITELSPLTDKPAVQERTTNDAENGGRESGGWRRWLRRVTAADSQELATTTRAMSALLDAGVPLDRALAYATTVQSPELRATFTRVRRAVRGGSTLADATAAESLLPSLFAPTIAAGEGAGTLARALSLLATYLDRSIALRNRLRSALAYPALLGVSSIIGVTVIMLVVVPRFAGLVADSGAALPLSTRALVGVSALVSRTWWVWIVAVAAVPLALRAALEDEGHRERIDAIALRLPVFGALLRARAAAAWCGTLSVALQSGLALLPAMRLARATVSNRVLNRGLATVEDRTRDGAPLAAGLEGLLPPLVVRLLDAGEASGTLASMAERAAESADGELQRTIATAVALVEPILIIGFGGLVGFIALALLQAIYGINARTL